MTVATKRSAKWSEVVMRVYQKFPAAFKSDRWDEIVKLANAGKVEAAMDLASFHQGEHKSHRAQNVIARRIRGQRVALFKLQREQILRVKAAFEMAGTALAHRMIHLPNNVSAIAPMRQSTRAVIVDLRRALNTILTDLVWKSILLGVKNMGEAIKPILRDARESMEQTLQEQTAIGRGITPVILERLSYLATEMNDIELLEDRLTIGMDKTFARRNKGSVDLGSEKWTKIVDAIYADIVRSNNTGLSMSERIWDLTNRAEQDIRRILASDIAAGKPSREIADRISKYVFTKGIDEDFQSGPGIYRSPLKNALRVARTETNRAYTKATAAWATNKPWVKAIRVTLSPAHKVEDDCDDVAGNEYSPDEFVNVIPVHPHCMCFGTYVIDEDYLTGDQTTGEEAGDE